MRLPFDILPLLLITTLCFSLLMTSVSEAAPATDFGAAPADAVFLANDGGCSREPVPLSSETEPESSPKPDLAPAEGIYHCWGGRQSPVNQGVFAQCPKEVPAEIFIPPIFAS